jgi:hypothetical protein
VLRGDEVGIHRHVPPGRNPAETATARGGLSRRHGRATAAPWATPSARLGGEGADKSGRIQRSRKQIDHRPRGRRSDARPCGAHAGPSCRPDGRPAPGLRAPTARRAAPRSGPPRAAPAGRAARPEPRRRRPARRPGARPASAPRATDRPGRDGGAGTGQAAGPSSAPEGRPRRPPEGLFRRSCRHTRARRTFRLPPRRRGCAGGKEGPYALPTP